MGMYESFAEVYDAFMDNVPYGEWALFIEEKLRGAGITDGLVLDLCCGTGKLTRLLARSGYDMIGADASADMLRIAQEKEAEDPLGILYLLQDARSFELYGTVRAIVSTCDSLNYLTEEADLEETFRLVNNYLDPGGLFLFDMNTPFHYEVLCADHTFAENRPEGSFIWENDYDGAERINEYDLTLYLERPGGSFERFQETHREKAWTLREVKAALEKAGLTVLQVLDGYRDEELKADSPRMVILAREGGKQQPVKQEH